MVLLSLTVSVLLYAVYLDYGCTMQYFQLLFVNNIQTWPLLTGRAPPEEQALDPDMIYQLRDELFCKYLLKYCAYHA